LIGVISPVKNDIVGVYRFYLGNELILEQKNAFTTAGRSIAIKSLLGIIPNFVNSIAYGIDKTANVFNSASTLITNNSLGFEIGRTPVVGNSFSLSGANDSLVFAGTIVDGFQYEINEVAIYPATNLNNEINVDGETLINFDTIDLFSKYGTASAAQLTLTSSARIGNQMLSLPTTGSASDYLELVTDNSTLASISRYSSEDVFKLAMINQSSSVAASVYFRFYTDDSNYYTLPVVSSSQSGYQIVQVTKASAQTTGTPDWNTISKVRLWNSSTQTVLLDAIKIDVGSYAIDTNFGMISRAVLATPIVKPASIPLNIQYSLIVNFDGGV